LPRPSREKRRKGKLETPGEPVSPNQEVNNDQRVGVTNGDFLEQQSPQKNLMFQNLLAEQREQAQ